MEHAIERGPSASACAFASACERARCRRARSVVGRGGRAGAGVRACANAVLARPGASAGSCARLAAARSHPRVEARRDFWCHRALHDELPNRRQRRRTALHGRRGVRALHPALRLLLRHARHSAHADARPAGSAARARAPARALLCSASRRVASRAPRVTRAPPPQGPAAAAPVAAPAQLLAQRAPAVRPGERERSPIRTRKGRCHRTHISKPTQRLGGNGNARKRIRI